MVFLWKNFLLPFLVSAAQAADFCKCSPTDSCWPSLSHWNALNISIDGRLIQGQPPASVCYPNTTNYDESACQMVIEQWTSSAWHANDPVSVDAPSVENGCYPIYPNGTNVIGDPMAGERGCDFNAYPAYVVNATDVWHVQAGVRFAYDHNLRLNVKGTGHGKSMTPSNLSIWTHSMKGSAFVPHFTAQGCGVKVNNVTQLAMKFGAGTVDREAYESAAEHNVAVVGGTDSTVGLVGWLSGGGHGYMTGTYGQGADNLLEATLVTPKGEILVANECQHSDMFWAIRGGGGGTFGVLTDLSMKAYPMPNVTLIAVDLSQRNRSNSSMFWKSVAAYLAETPRLKAGGLQGYLTVHGPHLTMSGASFVYNQPQEAVHALLAPVHSRLKRYNDSISFSATVQPAGSFIEMYHLFNLTEAAGGGGGTRTSRLIPAQALTENMDFLVKTLEKIGPKTGPTSGSIASPSLSMNIIASPEQVNNSLNPAWRSAVIHLITQQSWSGDAPAEEIAAATYRMTHEKGYALRQLAPDSGAYIDESDDNEPDWQWALYGVNYSRLQAIKARYDPSSSLWCQHCVGSEMWEEKDGGMLCKKSWAWDHPPLRTEEGQRCGLVSAGHARACRCMNVEEREKFDVLRRVEKGLLAYDAHS